MDYMARYPWHPVVAFSESWSGPSMDVSYPTWGPPCISFNEKLHPGLSVPYLPSKISGYEFENLIRIMMFNEKWFDYVKKTAAGRDLEIKLTYTMYL